MNERIRELAHEAGLPTYNPEGIPTKLEKFAELIVRECIETIKNNTPKLQENEWEYGALYGFEESVIVIREEFGIKE